MSDRDLCFTAATQLVRMFRARKTSPLEVLQAVLARIDAVNPRVNAYVTGLPAVSVPAGFTRDGLPVGLQIVGRRPQEAAVLGAAAAFEAAAPWPDRIPPVVTGAA